jgi:hypothetical protein
MLYSDARSIIKSGDLLAWRGRSLLSWLIRAVTGGSWTHVGVALWLGERLFVVEAREFRGVVLTPLSLRLPFDLVSTKLLIDNDDIDRALHRVGHKYSYGDAIRAGLGMRFSGKGDICSEYAANILREATAIAMMAPPDYPTPTALVEFYLNKGAMLRSVWKG